MILYLKKSMFVYKLETEQFSITFEQLVIEKWSFVHNFTVYLIMLYSSGSLYKCKRNNMVSIILT